MEQRLELRLEQCLEQENPIEEPKNEWNFRIKYDFRNPEKSREIIRLWVNRFLSNYHLFDQKGKESNLFIRAVYKLHPMEFLHMFGTSLPRPPEAIYAQIMPLNLRKKISWIQPRKGSIYSPNVEHGQLVSCDCNNGGSVVYHIEDAHLEILFKKIRDPSSTRKR